MRSTFAVVSMFLVATHPVFSQTAENFSFHLRPGADLPFGEKSALFFEDAAYKLGGTAALIGQYAFPKLPALFAEGGLNLGIHPTQAENFLTLTSAGAGIGYDIRLADRMSLQLGIEGGMSFGFFSESEPAGNPYLGGNIAAIWDLTPGFAISAGGTYRYHLGWDTAGSQYTDLYQGVSIWAGTVFRLKPDSGRQKLLISKVKTEPLFPVFFSYYEKNPFGQLTIQNLENSAITNVDIYFYVGEYMEQPMLTSSIKSLARNASVDVPLKALFTGRLMNLTESAKVSSEIRVSYTYLGERITYTHPLTITILDRNSMTWDDDRKAASFVTPRDPTVLIFSKNTAGLIRDLGHNPMNLNFRIAMGIFEAMRLYGLNYVIDPQSSFIEASQDALFLDYLQFPSQSLIYRAGDCDDLSILFAALLESVGIPTAFITIPGHIFMAFSLGMKETEARKTFTGANDFIYMNDDTWVPVEVTLVQEGFIKAYRTATKQWKEAVNKKVEGFFPIHEAWKVYQPVGFTGGTLSLLFPSADSVIQSYKANLDAFVTQEIQAQVEKYQSRLSREGEKASTRNSFGILYAKYGLFEHAETQFKAALKVDKKAFNAMVNLANIYFLQDRTVEAIDWYRSAAVISPDDELVIAGLARTLFEREEYDESQKYYARLIQLNPEIASQYAYLGNVSTSIVRASAARDKGKTFWDEEE
ncbi:MAG: hypothetical protein A2Y38_18815 [Spirochaetes bacterium GWB1_59_5]|nr:MAG: hypothetical protein A2Y38_18815 [Spirochaetes bacterium GWB1_59_5]